MNYELNITALQKALKSLKNAYLEYNKTQNEYVRDSVIQRIYICVDRKVYPKIH